MLFFCTSALRYTFPEMAEKAIGGLISKERNCVYVHRHNPKRIYFFAAVLLCSALSIASAQSADNSQTAVSTLQDHYNAAQAAQSAGDFESAAIQYKLFIASALGSLAGDYARIGEYTRASPLFDRALGLTPDDSGLLLDYAEASLAAKDTEKAMSGAEEALKLNPKNARAYLIMGRVQLAMNHDKQAKTQFEAAVALDPNFADGYALATAYLVMKDETGATKIFSEMLAGFGDTAAIHTEFGRAYVKYGYPEQAIEEFKAAIAKNGKLPGAHYSLGASYLLSMGEINFPQASVEFRKELEINPNDYLSLSQLGYIALSQHKFQEAETELTRAAALRPQDPDIFLSLGQLYMQTSRPSLAETALKRCIQATRDLSYNHYQVQRAHYLLGRILLQGGQVEEARKEMQISDELSKQGALQNQGKLNGTSIDRLANSTALTMNNQKTMPVDMETTKQIETFQRNISPAIADSYNNLGVIAASNKDFPVALGYFQNASEWNPILDGLDYNLGKAAFSASQYRQAILPLTRYLQGHPQDMDIRAALGMSLFMQKDYSGALKTLRPIETRIDTVPQLDYIYAVSLVKTGEYDKGVDRLKALETSNPNVLATHRTLGEAYASRGSYSDAAMELRTAIQLSPGDIDAKLDLANVLVKLKEMNEAQKLLLQAISVDSKNAAAYQQLGMLQLGRGDVNGAIANLEKSAQLDPDSSSIHHDLSIAYRTGSRIADAEREAEKYKSMQSGNASKGASLKTN